ncbi:MAG: NAD(P)H-hydrate dehydratase [Deferribacterota bacterium]|nr:NAD(P)H-hydrate dehydratase [Deferribacterota bacterium]
MLIIAGTIPIKEFPLIYDVAEIDKDYMLLKDYKIPISQGTTTMIAAANKVSNYLKNPKPYVLIAGDIGYGDGTKKIYNYLIKNIDSLKPDVLALHYCLPIMGLVRKLIEVIDKNRLNIKLVADASSMYAAKAAGLAQKFELFTPDTSEICFLADKEAVHPAYIKKHLFIQNSDIEKLVEDAYKYNNAPKYLLVKGKTDYIVCNGVIAEKIDEPNIPELEAIGGTGDTITGLVSALLDAPLDTCEASVIAAKINRLAGQYIKADVSTRIIELISIFNKIFDDYLQKINNINLKLKN